MTDPMRWSETTPASDDDPQPDTAPSIDVSIVIPVFEEAPNLPELWSRIASTMRGAGTTWEMVFVDDGSRDETPQVLAELRRTEPEVRVLTARRNRGQSAALAAGFRMASGAWVVTLDADLQNPPEEIAKLLAAREEHTADIYFGRRIKRRDSQVKRLSSKIGNGFRNRVTGHTVADTGCSLKLMRRSALITLPMFNGMHRFLPTLFAGNGFEGFEVPVEHAERKAGVSKYGVWGRARRGAVDCFAVRWLLKRSVMTSDPPVELDDDGSVEERG